MPSKPQPSQTTKGKHRVWVWLSFDLGIRGDFDGMYQFLGQHEAKECGDSLGAFYFAYENDLAKELKSQIEATVKLDKRSRIYAIIPRETETRRAVLVRIQTGAPVGRLHTLEGPRGGHR